MRVLDLFSGIGGFALGLQRAGMTPVAFCEIEEFPRRVLAKHWPGVPIYDDVRTLTAERLAADGIAVDVITGGFPCQDISCAGRKAGLGEGTRSGLWSEIVRLVRDLRPAYLVVENVANLLAGPSEQPGGWFGRVLGDLAECGYDAEWENIPAAAVGAPHRRERVWLVAYPERKGVFEYRLPAITGAAMHNRCGVFGHGIQGRREEKAGDLDRGASRAVDPAREGLRSLAALAGTSHGVPNRLDRVAALGNAVVPQIPELIGRAIMAAEASRLQEAA